MLFVSIVGASYDAGRRRIANRRRGRRRRRTVAIDSRVIAEERMSTCDVAGISFDIRNVTILTECLGR